MTAANLYPAARRALDAVRDRAEGPPLSPEHRVTLNFHPDRASEGRTVLQALVSAGRYENQFVTGTSNGGLTAHAGGDRWRWEQRIFDSAYDDVDAHQRPKYGALNYARKPLGAAARFGSAHLVLAAHVLHRTTFCFPDSVFEPEHFGVAQSCDLIDRARAFASIERTDAQEQDTGGVLDDYIEAQVHGPITMADDVEALVLDPCFVGTPIESQAQGLPVEVRWHEGRVLTAKELAAHPDFRGPRMVQIGTQIAVDGLLDAAILGRAVHEGAHDPQDLKKVWHCIARFGRPR